MLKFSTDIKPKTNLCQISPMEEVFWRFICIVLCLRHSFCQENAARCFIEVSLPFKTHLKYVDFIQSPNGDFVFSFQIPVSDYAKFSSLLHIKSGLFMF